MLTRNLFVFICLPVLLVLTTASTHAESFGHPDPAQLFMKGYQPVSFDRDGTTIKGFFIRPETAGKVPAAVVAPSCTGLMLSNGQLVRPYYRDMVTVLTDAGLAVLLVDGFTSRGQQQLCAYTPATAPINWLTRFRDVLAARDYVHNHKDIDSRRIYLVGFGASGGLHIMNRLSAHHREVTHDFAGAVLLFPYCQGVREKFSPVAPVLAIAGQLGVDQWNPPRACQQLQQRLTPNSVPFRLTSYPDTYHGFVEIGGVRSLNEASQFDNVMIGGNWKTAEEAYTATADFLRNLPGGR